MARKRVRKQGEAGELNMTAMIDVVFQLLIYFIFTIEPKDVIAHLDVFRPSPEKRQEQMVTPPKMIKIMISPGGYITINERPVGKPELDALLGKLAAIEKNQTIMIMCQADSQHADLVGVLDLCAKNGLTNLSVVSTN